MTRRVRLAYLVSHPIQYQAPLLRRIAKEPDIDLAVLFGSDFSARGYQDKGFGVEVAWDVPLLEGYRYRVLPVLRDNGTVTATTPLSRGILRALLGPNGEPAFDALWVHGYASVNALHGILAAKALGIPVLLRAESWLGDRERHPAKQIAKRAFFFLLRPFLEATLPIGSRNAAYWAASLGETVPQFPMPYAVDNAYFAQRATEAAPRSGALRAELDLEPDAPVVLFASKLQSRKHADHLIRAVAHLKQRHNLACSLLLAGEGEEREHLQRLASEHELCPYVRFLGFRNQSELPALFALARCFVLPSRHEPWGLIVNEAMAAGCPVVVSSDVGAAADLVVEGTTGYTYPAGDVEALADALAKILHSPARADAMGVAAQQRMNTWSFEQDVSGLRCALAHTTGRLRP